MKDVQRGREILEYADANAVMPPNMRDPSYGWTTDPVPRSWPCTSPLQDIAPQATASVDDMFYTGQEAAASIADIFYTGQEAIAWQGPLPYPKPPQNPPTKAEIDEWKLGNSRRVLDKVLYNRQWCYREDAYWFNGQAPVMGSTLGRTLARSIIQIPPGSGIPLIKDIPQDTKTQMTAWLLIMHDIYPEAKDEELTAIINRLWYGPQIIYHMIYRVHTELPTGKSGISVTEVEEMCRDQQLWGNDEIPRRVAELRVGKKFKCRFPNPRTGNWIVWDADFDCAMETIERAAERLDLDLVKAAPRGTQGF
ncbi:MAG: hypothetical protein Q9218_003084 [Villophora microphyllina]